MEVSRNNLLVYKFRFLICVFELSFVILCDNCNNVFPPVLTPGVVLEEKEPFIA